MKVKDAFKKLEQLKMDKIWYQCIIEGNPYHVDFDDIRKAIKDINREVYRIEELIYNQELDNWNEEY